LEDIMSEENLFWICRLFTVYRSDDGRIHWSVSTGDMLFKLAGLRGECPAWRTALRLLVNDTRGMNTDGKVMLGLADRSTTRAFCDTVEALKASLGLEGEGLEMFYYVGGGDLSSLP
jgi:hypothetical protein